MQRKVTECVMCVRIQFKSQIWNPGLNNGHYFPSQTNICCKKVPGLQIEVVLQNTRWDPRLIYVFTIVSYVTLEVHMCINTNSARHHSLVYACEAHIAKLFGVDRGPRSLFLLSAVLHERWHSYYHADVLWPSITIHDQEAKMYREWIIIAVPPYTHSFW